MRVEGLNMEKFTKEEIIEALSKSIALVFKKEGKLLSDKCHEQAVTHWLANYFLYYIKKIKKTENTKNNEYSSRKIFNNKNGYTVDVEYNRIGEGGNTKHIDSNKGDSGAVSIDMVFHRRSASTSPTTQRVDNILCVEVKSTKTEAVTSNYSKIKSDSERVQALASPFVRESNNLQPSYQFGATVYFYDFKHSCVRLYESERSDWSKPSIYHISHKAEDDKCILSECPYGENNCPYSNNGISHLKYGQQK